MGRYGLLCGPLWAVPEKISNVSIYSEYSNGFELIQLKDRVFVLENFQIKYGFVEN
jgi:hypothetical protein